MDKKAYARARQEADLAAAKLNAMQNAVDLASYAQLWSEFLGHIQRTFTKMKIATTKGASKGWYDKIESQRRDDELLSYIRHARNADEHGVEPVTVQRPGGIGIGPKIGNSLYVDHLEIRNGEMIIGPELAKNAKIEFIPASVHLSSVRDRGLDYQPPRNHLGTTLQETTPIVVAQAALKYLQTMLSEAEQFAR